MDPTQTGAWIAALRKEMGLTQKELAERLRVTDKAVSRWETGKGYPDISLLPALAEALGCTINELLSGKRLSPEEAPAAAEENLSALCRTACQPLPNDRRLFDDSRVEIGADKIVIRWGWGHAFSVGIFLMMALIGGGLAGKLLSGCADWEWNVPEILSVVFFGLWLLGSTAMLIIVILTRTKTLTIDRDGVTVKRPIDTKTLRWEQILDYGVAFSYKNRGAVYYELYFSDVILADGDMGSKKSVKTTVRIDLVEMLMDRCVSLIMDFCADHTQVTPFLVHPYDRLRFQPSAWDANSAATEPEQSTKRDRSLRWAAFAALGAGILCLVLDRILGTQSELRLLPLIGGGISLTAGIAVLWADIRFLRRVSEKGLRVEEVDWSAFLEILILGLLAVGLGIAILALALHGN